MKIKQIDKNIDKVLWGIFVLLVLGSLYLAYDFSAPKYEIVESDVRFPYEYVDDDGNKQQSEYQLAWYHEDFSKPQIVAYDPTTDEAVVIKDEYISEYKSIMPESKYSFIHRCFWVVFAILALISAALVYFVGGAIRDYILYLIIKRNPTFTNCAYFLYDASDRKCKVDSVRLLIGEGIGKYIDSKKEDMFKKYKPEFANLVINLLQQIRKQNSTTISFDYIYENKTISHMEYLKSLVDYWRSMIGKDESAAENLKILENDLIPLNYVLLSVKTTKEDLLDVVSKQLKMLFSEIMGDDVFNFQANKSNVNSEREDAIYLKTTIENSTKYFYWGSDKSKFYPGINVMFEIYHYVEGKKSIMWKRYLPAKCTYSAEESNFSVDSLYNTMVKDTISSFNDVLKS